MTHRVHKNRKVGTYRKYLFDDNKRLDLNYLMNSHVDSLLVLQRKNCRWHQKCWLNFFLYLQIQTAKSFSSKWAHKKAFIIFWMFLLLAATAANSDSVHYVSVFPALLFQERLFCLSQFSVQPRLQDLLFICSKRLHWKKEINQNETINVILGPQWREVRQQQKRETTMQ